MADHPDVVHVVRSVAAAPFATDHAPPARVSNDVFGRVLQLARGTSLTGQLLFALENQIITITAYQQSRLLAQHRAAMIHALRVEEALIRSVDVLGAAGIRSAVLKGVALAHTVYEDPSFRTYTDADLLVEPTRLTESAARLGVIGGLRALPEVRPGFDDRFSKDLPVVVGTIGIDLHRTLASGPFGIDINGWELLDRGQRVVLADHPMATPDLEDMYIHAAITAGVGDVPPRPVTLTDMLRISNAAGFRQRLVVERAERWGVAAAVTRGVMNLRSTLGLSEPPPMWQWAVSRTPSLIERILVRSYLQSGRSYKRTLSMLLRLDHEERLTFIRAITWPSPAYLDARQFERLTHFRRAARKLLP